MKGTIQDLNICGYDCSIYLPKNYCKDKRRYPVVYINGDNGVFEIIDGIEPHFNIDCEFFILIGIEPKCWNDDCTPWPAPALTKKDDSFGGNASNYLHFLVNAIKPFIDTHYKTKPEPENTTLIGYSLGGLIALYAIYTSGTFGKVGSISGSLWYDKWIKFMESNIPVNTDSKVYLSLGKGEERSRNNRIARVGSCTRRAFEIMSRQVSHKEKLILEWNDGGHFAEIPKRFMRAILWLM